MKIRISKDELSGGLRKVLSVVSTKTTIPVLSNVLLEAEEDKLFLTTSDLEVCIRTAIPAAVDEPGTTTLPAKKFGQIVNAFSGDKVLLETDEEQNTSVSCGKSHFRIVGLDPSEFPTEEELEGNWAFAMPSREIRKAFSKVSYAASLEDSRQVLNGILLSMRGGLLTVVATDGRRLALVEKPLEDDSNPDGDVILPSKMVGEVEKLMGGEDTVQVEVTDSKAAFGCGDTLITSKLVDGNYPNYRQVIPGNFSRSAVIPREAFAAALNRVSMVVSETSASVKMVLENATMTLQAASTEVGDSSEPLEISYEGEPIDIAFNPVFMMDPLRQLECDQVILQFNDRFSPMSISGDEGFLYVIMPMRG